VALATLLSMHPDILLLDEPTSNLDASSVRRLVELLKHQKHTMLIATHDLPFAREVCDRSVRL
jgi:cobalt/nickel transport system ATP-binding protein